MPTFTLVVDPWRFPDGVAFPGGLDSWPAWLDGAVSHFTSSGQPFAWDSIVVDAGPPEYIVLTAMEPNLKIAVRRVGLRPYLDDSGLWVLLVADVQ
ncbi:MAG: hypothetical protein JWN10_2430 [Solirubrobacterales bacterium]|nr:hypothetical protein [Solirubrobacterales bacterium]